MRRSGLQIGLVTILCLLSVPKSRSEEKQKNLDAENLLSKAYNNVDIKAAGSAPFVMIATAHLQDGSHKVDGIYAIPWAAPDRFREVFKFPDFTETDVALNGTIYIKRSVHGLPLMIYELMNLTHFLDHYKLQTLKTWKLRFKRIETVRAGTACTIFDGDFTSQICVDADQRPTLVEDHRDRSFLDRYEFGSYRDFGSKQVPYKLTTEDWDKRKVELDVVRLMPVKSFAASEFMPPQDARTEGFCLDPKFDGDFHLDPWIYRAGNGHVLRSQR